ncbi:MAG: cytochrome c maturation protein CcmE [Pseudomonadota bacterium]
MHPLRKQRLQIILFVLLAVAVAVSLLLYALRENINLFYPPADIAAGKVAVGQQIRAGGMVREGSVKRNSESLQVRFVVTDYAADLIVNYDGILPDMFAEGAGVVVAGKLVDGGEFEASEVLAKHDENYMPPEVAETLKKPGASGEADY